MGTLRSSRLDGGQNTSSICKDMLDTLHYFKIMKKSPKKLDAFKTKDAVYCICGGVYFI